MQDRDTKQQLCTNCGVKCFGSPLCFECKEGAKSVHVDETRFIVN